MTLSTNDFNSLTKSRRSFLKTTGIVAAAGSLALPQGIHAGENDETIRIGLIGCGGRGSGAAVNCMNADPNVKLVAVGDMFKEKATGSLGRLKKAKGEQVQVDDDHIFAGFDAYQKVIDSDVDLVLLCAVPQFRPKHIAAAVKAGKHIFCEKPIAIDAAGVRSVLETCKQAKEKNLSVVSGLCYRYDSEVIAVMEEVHNGAIGDIREVQETYVTGPVGRETQRTESMSELEYQIRNWYFFDWLSGDHIVEQHVHSLDKGLWALGDIDPIGAWGMGARVSRTLGNIYDQHAVVFEFPGGVRMHAYCRQQAGCYRHGRDLIVGTKGEADAISPRCKIKFKDGTQWRYKGERPNKLVQEHIALITSIKEGKPINNGDYMCRSTMVAILGRMVNYTGKYIKYADALASTKQLAPTDLSMSSEAPAKPNADGTYPVAIPGT